MCIYIYVEPQHECKMTFTGFHPMNPHGLSISFQILDSFDKFQTFSYILAIGLQQPSSERIEHVPKLHMCNIYGNMFPKQMRFGNNLYQHDILTAAESKLYSFGSI